MRSSAYTRILMLLENCPYPQDDRVRREARSLMAAAYKVTIISPRLDGQPWREIVQGATVYRYPSPRGGNGAWSYFWEYGYSLTVIFFLSLYVLLRDGFDIIHAHQPPDMLAWIAGFYKLLGKKYVLDHHDLAPELFDARFRRSGNSTLKHFLIRLEKFSCHIADHIIATNQSYKLVEMQRSGVPEERITVVRNGPDLSEVVQTAPNPSTKINGKIVIGYVGVTGVQDGVDYLLRAIHHLVFELGRKDIICVIVGSGSALPGLKVLSSQLDLGTFVRFTGWVDGQEQVWSYLYSMDIGVAPEPSDPYNNLSTAAKVMEYMAAGKPIVSFDLPEHRFTAGDAAVYARTNDEVDFAQKLEFLITHPAERERLGSLGIVRIQNQLSWQHQENLLLKLYEALSHDGK